MTVDQEHELILRHFLWWRHGHEGEALYGDDGELQCKACGHWDYRRDDINVLIEQAMGQSQLVAVQEAAKRAAQRPCRVCDRLRVNVRHDPHYPDCLLEAAAHHEFQ